MSITWIIIIVVVVLILLWLVLTYNGFIRLRNQVENSWSQIDVQLKRRVDLIPNLIETVKGYVKHERETLESVTKARTSLMNAGSDPKKAARADNMLSGALKSLFAVSESYPQLQANTNFLQLQEELTGTENKIAAARQYYNDMAMAFNTKKEKVPSNIVASMFGFKKKDLFETTGSQREPVKVKF